MLRSNLVEGVTIAHHHVVRDRFGRVLEILGHGFAAQQRARWRARELTKDRRTDYPPCYEDSLVDGEYYFTYDQNKDAVRKRHRDA